MRTLIVYYSRGGITREHMVWLKEALAAEQMVAVRAKHSYNGFWGTLRACRGIISGNAAIEPPSMPLDISAYDLVVLGAPVWAGRPAVPMRVFLKQYGQGIRRCAAVITHSSPNVYGKALDELDGLTGVRRVAALSVSKFDKDTTAKRKEFIQTIGEIQP